VGDSLSYLDNLLVWSIGTQHKNVKLQSRSQINQSSINISCLSLFVQIGGNGGGGGGGDDDDAAFR